MGTMITIRNVPETLHRREPPARGGARRTRAAMIVVDAVHRYPHDWLLPRVWELRSNLTADDAVYVALAEALDAPLVTRDGRLAAAAGHGATIELV